MEPRKSYKFQGVVTALSSISHIGETLSVNAKLRREPIVQPDGTVEHVPIVSGNSLRGALRDAGMRYMHDRLGKPPLPLSAFYFLFSGGSLGKASTTINLAWEKRLKELIPLVGIFGGAAGNHIMPGRLDMGKLVPLCEETKHLLPPKALEGWTLTTVWDYVHEEAYTRTDDAKNPHYLHRINEADVKMLAGQAEQKELIAGTSEDIDRDTGKKQQMRYYTECLSAGTRLWWEVALYDVSDLEFEAFLSCLVEFAKNPVIGGKHAIGHGKVSVKFDNWLTISPHIETGSVIATPLGKLYEEHIAANKDSILALMRDLAA